MAENEEHKSGHIFPLDHFTYFVKLMWLTFADVSISFVSRFTGTLEATWGVSACGITATIGATFFTLVDIYVIINSFIHSFIHSFY